MEGKSEWDRGKVRSCNPFNVASCSLSLQEGKGGVGRGWQSKGEEPESRDWIRIIRSRIKIG